MDLSLLLGSLLLTLLLSGRLRRTVDSCGRGAVRSRAALVLGAGLTLVPWTVLHGIDRFGAGPVATAVLGSFLGSLTATALGSGIVEDNAPPSDAMRENVRAFHRDVDLRYPPEPRYKRIFDVTVATVGIVVTLPLWIVIPALIWLEEPGPVIFIKNSVGKTGVTFRQLKFRSMRYDAEALTGPVSSCPQDPRALRVGRCLRRWHVDELPELLNVLAGQMSIVGPRPLRTVLVHHDLQELPEFAERHTVRPGIACTAQIEGYRMSPYERLHKDRAYIRDMSMSTDIALLCRAVTTTVGGQRDRTEVSRDMSLTAP